MQKTYKSIEELPAMLTVKDIKILFCIGQAQAYELVHADGFPAMKVGGSIKVPKHLLMRWLEDGVKKGVGNQC